MQYPVPNHFVFEKSDCEQSVNVVLKPRYLNFLLDNEFLILQLTAFSHKLLMGSLEGFVLSSEYGFEKTVVDTFVQTC